MTHVIKIDIVTGHVEMGNLHFILHICRKTRLFLKTYTINYESIA